MMQMMTRMIWWIDGGGDDDLEYDHADDDDTDGLTVVVRSAVLTTMFKKPRIHPSMAINGPIPTEQFFQSSRHASCTSLMSRILELASACQALSNC